MLGICDRNSGGDGAVFCVRETLDFSGNLERGVLGGEGGRVCLCGRGAEGRGGAHGQEDEAKLRGGLFGYFFRPAMFDWRRKNRSLSGRISFQGW